MEVVYFFYESSEIRIPFFCYDKPLFQVFIRQGGRWDKEGNQFIFQRGFDVKQFAHSFPGIIVRVEKNTATPIRLSGFRKRPWEQRADTCPVNQGSKMNTAVPAIADALSKPLSLPEKFPEHWQVKLEEILRSRKYSPQTRRSYQYYNRLLCSTLQKSPDEIRQEDITCFLAFVGLVPPKAYLLQFVGVGHDDLLDYRLYQPRE